MTTLVVGASGATGRLLVKQLLDRGQPVKAVVRAPGTLSALAASDGRLTLVTASLLDLGDAELSGLVAGCDAVASCLGHTMNWNGIFGAPRRLVTDAARRLCAAIKATQPAKPVRFVLMNTAANRVGDAGEPPSFAERGVLGLLRLLLPPHVDNEQAASYLRTAIGAQDGTIEWAAVRPDSLFDEDQVSDYRLYPAPTRSALFNPGKTSRINVGHFMAELIADDACWQRWKGGMPVIYNEPPPAR